MTEPNAAEWLSAWSTLWGAIAGGVGAIGTAGALWLGAVTFRRQVQDNHRGQARAITVTLEEAKGYIAKSTATVWNNSGFPIYGVALVVENAGGQELDQKFQHALPPGTRLEFDTLKSGASNAYATFVDSAGSRWRRYFNGDLEEMKKRGRAKESVPDATDQSG